jgi:hypothetical protein
MLRRNSGFVFPNMPSLSSVGAVDGVIFDIARQQLGSKKGSKQLVEVTVGNQTTQSTSTLYQNGTSLAAT